MRPQDTLGVEQFIKYMLPGTHCLKPFKGGLWNNLFSVWAPPGGLANPEPLEGVHLPEANHHDSLHLTDMSLVFLARQPLAWVDQSAGLNRSMVNSRIFTLALYILANKQF